MSSPQGIAGICFKNSLSLLSNKVRRVRLGSISRGRSLNDRTFSAKRSFASLIDAVSLSLRSARELFPEQARRLVPHEVLTVEHEVLP